MFYERIKIVPSFKTFSQNVSVAYLRNVSRKTSSKSLSTSRLNSLKVTISGLKTKTLSDLNSTTPVNDFLLFRNAHQDFFFYCRFGRDLQKMDIPKKDSYNKLRLIRLDLKRKYSLGDFVKSR